MDKVYMLTKQQDYEGADVYGVYKEVPSVPYLTDVLKDSFGYCLDHSVLEHLAEELHTKRSVCIMRLHTWKIGEWGVL